MSQLADQLAGPCGVTDIDWSQINWDPIIMSVISGVTSSILGIWGDYGNIFFGAGIDMMFNTKSEAINRGGMYPIETP